MQLPIAFLEKNRTRKRQNRDESPRTTGESVLKQPTEGIKKNIVLFICLAGLGLTCSMLDLVP